MHDPRIIPLEWRQVRRWRDVAESILGEYSVEQEIGDDRWRWRLQHVVIGQLYDTVTAAKGAAEADYLERLGKALKPIDPLPDPPVIFDDHEHAAAKEAAVLIWWVKVDDETDPLELDDHLLFRNGADAEAYAAKNREFYPNSTYEVVPLGRVSA